LSDSLLAIESLEVMDENLKVLVADDDLIIRTMLETFLQDWGYEVSLVNDGAAAWEILRGDAPPDLALLDWLMPGFTGVELCRKMQDKPRSKYTYVMLITGKNDRNDLIMALEAGADDFLSKPLNMGELKTRLEVGARIVRYEKTLREQHKLLKDYAVEMEALAEKRAKQLVHADRMAALGKMSAGIAHEINNPLSFISSNVQTMEMFWREVAPHIIRIAGENPQKNNKLELVIQDAPKTLEGVRSGIVRVRNIVQGLKAFARQDKGERAPGRIGESIDRAMELCRSGLKKLAKVELKLAPDLPLMNINSQQIEQVLVNLILNAVDAMEESSRGALKIAAVKTNKGVEIEISDNGPGIAEDVLAEIWNPFFTTKKTGKGTGLGLSISKGIIEDHGGQIRAENKKDGGARFIIELPE